MVDDIKSFIDFVYTAILNCWNVYKNNGGVFFYITVICMFFYPIFSKLLRALRSNK